MMEIITDMPIANFLILNMLYSENDYMLPYSTLRKYVTAHCPLPVPTFWGRVKSLVNKGLIQYLHFDNNKKEDTYLQLTDKGIAVYMQNRNGFQCVLQETEKASSY